MNVEMTADVDVSANAETSRLKSLPIRIRWADFVILFLALGAAVATIVPITGRRESALVSIKTPNGVFLYPLQENKTIALHGTLGNTVVAIEDSTIHVIESPCRDKLCIRAGTLSKPGQWTACLPNGIYIQIINDSQEHEVDAIVK